LSFAQWPLPIWKGAPVAAQVSDSAVRLLHVALIATLVLFAGVALAQDEPIPPEETPPPDESGVPEGDASPPADASPAEAATPAAPETIEVQTGDAQAVPPPDGTRLDTMQVTGSRIKRTDYETAQPVLVVSREDIERTGLTSIGDLLQDLAPAGSALGTTFNNGGTGAIEVDLRNLGSNRVLVLVNGHRWVNGLRALGTNVVDLTTVPISLVERIEVLKDGASAIYGSDAVAGVINIITRKDFQGAELRTYFAGYDEGDGLTQSHALSFGNVSPDTNLFLDLSFTRQDGIYTNARDQFKDNIPGTGRTRGSGTTEQGRFVFSPTPGNEAALSALDPDACTGFVPLNLCDVTLDLGADGQNIANYVHYTSDYSYNVSGDNYFVTPNERTALYGQIGHKLGQDVQFDAELLYNLRRSRQALAPMPIQVGDLVAFPPFGPVYVSATNIYNPFDQDIGRGAGGAPLAPGFGGALRRNVEGGQRIFRQDVDTLRGGATFSGVFDIGALDRVLDWDVGYSYGESKGTDTSDGLLNMNRVARALGPDVDCQNDPEGACVPLNLFGSGTITPEMLDYIMYEGSSTTRQVMRDAYANISADLFDFGTGMITAALGVEYREERFESIPDPLVQQGISSTNRADPTRGGYDVKEGFVEFAIPLLSELPYADALDLSLAARHSDYSRYGTADTGKIGLRYKPIEDLLVRSTYSTSFRAPSVGELFLGNSDSFSGAIDPCSADSRAINATADTNCGADGVPNTVVQLLPQILDVFQGNQDLEPEKATTLTAGVVWSPEFVPDLNLYFDWYRIELDNYITIPGAQYLLDACYTASTDPGRRRYCNQIQRDPVSGQVTEIFDPYLNFARLETEGFDVTADYVLPWFREAGKFKVISDAAYLTDYEIHSEAPDGTAVVDRFAGTHGFFTAYPRLRANLALDWALEQWSASWSVRYVHAVMEPCVDGLEPSLRDMGLCTHPDPNVSEDDPATPDVDETDPDESENELARAIYHNVRVGYDITAFASKIELGVNNLFDQDPSPAYVFSPVYGYEPTMYEVPGRFLYVRLQKRF
jgi:iron complex outermembrane recepter protein